MAWLKGEWWCSSGHWTLRRKKIYAYGGVYCGPCWSVMLGPHKRAS